MKIGIDIDNVISSFDNELLKEYLKHDKELRGTGIINENAEYIRRGVDINTVYHIKESLKLRNYLDKLLGCSVYDFFPDIKENL